MKKINFILFFLFVISLILSGCIENNVIDDGNNEGMREKWIDEGLLINNGWYWNPEVVKLDNGSYRMYVEDHGESGDSLIGIVSLISNDGIKWSYESLVKPGAGQPGVIQLTNGTWRLYYQSQDGIKSAISNNGLNFTDEAGTRLENFVELEGAKIRHPCVVLLDNGAFRMYYDTDAKNGSFIRIWSAYSRDGLNFSREHLRLFT